MTLDFLKKNFWNIVTLQMSWLKAQGLQMRKWEEKGGNAIHELVGKSFKNEEMEEKRRKRECTFSKRPTQWKRRWEKTFHKVVQHFIPFTPIHQKNISHIFPSIGGRVTCFERKTSKIGTLDSLPLDGPHIQTRRTLVHLLYH